MSKRITSFLAPLILLFAVLSWGGCNKCKKVDCENGTCVRGECVCDFGWEGSDCATAFRDKFVGTWSGASYCNSGVGIFTVTVSAGATNDLAIEIFNLYDSGETVSGDITASDRINIPAQALGSTTVVGNGNYDSETGLIQIFYTVGSNNPPEDCVVELTQP